MNVPSSTAVCAIESDAPLSHEAIAKFVHDCLAAEDVDGKKALCIIPDGTRTMPMADVFAAACEALGPRAAQVDFLVALGTHAPMPQDKIDKHLGITPDDRTTTYRDIGIHNHDWKNPDALTHIGTIPAADTREISGGMLDEDVPVHINSRVLDADIVFVFGPVFPHEVVGFSGGNKYFFPGVAGSEILNFFHWLGALITNPEINGTKHTPVREVVNRAAAMIPVEKRAFCLNVRGEGCGAIYYGTPEEAWEPAADRAAQTHVRYVDKPFKTVLAVCSPLYEEVWTAGKCMYKLEPVVADGGELIIYGPHVKDVSVTHGEIINRIGYHTRDYFLAQMDRFADVPRGVLAHSTHVRGIGSFEAGVEKPRIDVTLATAIPESECRAINLGYRDPASIEVSDYENREDEGILVVHHAGETLYKLR